MVANLNDYKPLPNSSQVILIYSIWSSPINFINEKYGIWLNFAYLTGYGPTSMVASLSLDINVIS